MTTPQVSKASVVFTRLADGKVSLRIMVPPPSGEGELVLLTDLHFDSEGWWRSVASVGSAGVPAPIREMMARQTHASTLVVATLERASNPDFVEKPIPFVEHAKTEQPTAAVGPAGLLCDDPRCLGCAVSRQVLGITPETPAEKAAIDRVQASAKTEAEIRPTQPASERAS